LRQAGGMPAMTPEHFREVAWALHKERHRTLDRAAIENLNLIHDPFFEAHESLFKSSQD
jgi:hypothetical protein